MIISDHFDRDGNPLLADTLSIGASSSYFERGLGINISYGIGVDLETYRICSTVTVCGRSGVGSSSNARITVSYGTGGYSEGNRGSGGFFAGGGSLLFAAASTRTNSDGETTVSFGLGRGKGFNAGGQMCMTETICHFED